VETFAGGGRRGWSGQAVSDAVFSIDPVEEHLAAALAETVGELPAVDLGVSEGEPNLTYTDL
jgi:hypothetical protein